MLKWILLPSYCYSITWSVSVKFVVQFCILSKMLKTVFSHSIPVKGKPVLSAHGVSVWCSEGLYVRSRESHWSVFFLKHTEQKCGVKQMLGGLCRVLACVQTLPIYTTIYMLIQLLSLSLIKALYLPVIAVCDGSEVKFNVKYFAHYCEWDQCS